jgi:hypothetical protein
MFSAGLLLFTVAAAACGLSTTPEMLIAARPGVKFALAAVSANLRYAGGG